MSQWYECKYCDCCFPPITEDGAKFCRNCGAEWNPVLIDEPDDEDSMEA
jgi:hypothetical protein